MKQFFIFFHLLVIALSAFSQKKSKPQIDAEAIDKWVYASDNAQVSSDGSYLVYTIYNQPYKHKTLVLKSIKGDKQTELIDYSVAFEKPFSPDSKSIFLLKHDTLVSVQLRDGKKIILGKFSAIRQPVNQNNRWLAGMDELNKETVLYDLQKNKISRYKEARDYFFDQAGNFLILISGKEQQRISIVDLHTSHRKTIWEGSEMSNVIFDNNGKRMAFISGSSGDLAIWSYDLGADQPKIVFQDGDRYLASDTIIYKNSGLSFTNSGEKLLFDVISKKELAEKLQKEKYESFVVVHSYFDKENTLAGTLNPKQEFQTTKVMVNTTTQKLQTMPFHQLSNDFWLLGDSAGRLKIYNADKNSIIDLPSSGFKRGDLLISSNFKFIMNFDTLARVFNVVNCESGKFYKLSKPSNSNWGKINFFGKIDQPKNYGWTDKDEVLIEDEYGDIFLVDLNGIRTTKSITNQLGKNEHLQFELKINWSTLSKINLEETLIILGYDKITKATKYYSYSRKNGLNAMGEYSDFSEREYIQGSGSDKSFFADAKSNGYVLLRSAAGISPNFYLTKDFKSFKKLSNVHPEKEYNWLTAELLNWTTKEGKSLQGVLYKPENFDLTKRYPVILHYYEEKSNEYNMFHRPALSGSSINIPWFVSHGYLVCLVDMNFEKGNTGGSAFKCITAAADYLEKLPFINIKKMGLQGHSFGGYQTNYFITQTDRFAAAMSSAGVSDLTAEYNSYWGWDGRPKDGYILNGQGRMGTTPYAHQQSFLRNSPIFQADRVRTPLLMMANKSDLNVPFMQGFQFFLALQHLNQKVWLLEYPHGGHFVGGETAEQDYTKRIEQFFDHYLKDKSAPLWMTQKMPYYDRQNLKKYLKLDTLATGDK